MKEKILKAPSGLPMILFLPLSYLAAIGVVVWGGTNVNGPYHSLAIAAMVASALYLALGWILAMGIKVIKPQEALVLTLFGRYTGTLKGAGIYYVNPFSTAVNPAAQTKLRQSGDVQRRTEGVVATGGANNQGQISLEIPSKKISLKDMTLSNQRQKINDLLGNPVEIAIAVVWRVTDTAKAAFNVDNYMEFLSLQCDASLRNVVRLYPYDIAQGVDTTGDGKPDEGSLRGSSDIVAQRIQAEVQEKVEHAGIEVVETKITFLAYAQEIAAAMLQRQQATALIDARKLIVDGAVGMVELALAKLEESNSVHLDEERKAAMVSNLLVVLCSNRDSQPVVNTGSLY